MYLLKYFLVNRLWMSYSWEFCSKTKWSWYDIEWFKIYQYWDNVKQINWKLSAKYDKEIVNVYTQEKDAIIDIFIDNNINLKFFYDYYKKFLRFLLIFSNSLWFKFNIFCFKNKKIKKIAENNFIDINFFKKNNNFEILFNSNEFNKKHPKIIISDFLFIDNINKIIHYSWKLYFWVFPIKKFLYKKNYPVLNWYYNFWWELFYNYEKTINDMKKIWVVDEF